MTATNEQFYYQVTPLLLRAGVTTEVVIHPLFDHCRFREGGEYAVTLYPMEELAQSGVKRDSPYKIKARDGVLRICDTFPGEQEYLLHIDALSGDEVSPIGDFRLYALADDLFDRRPYKGDTHLHSSRSDGVESPAYVAAACRRIGLDFMAVTDHWRYAPSLEAQQAFADLPIDLQIFPGEEIHHYPYNPVHIVNFGGKFSVNSMINPQEPPERKGANQSSSAEYMAAVQEIADSLPEDPNLNYTRRFQYAQCLWTYQQIRQAAGLAVFCHPYWFECRWYNVPSPLIDRHFIDQPFDAYEIIGGYHADETESNLLQVARYHEECARGRKPAIVGASDSHGCETGSLFGWYFTIVFAASAELPDLIQAIKDGYSVAVEALPNERPRAHGSFRLVKYAQYLLRELFPTHDSLCVEEGRLMLAHLTGDNKAAQELKQRQGRVARWWNEQMGK